MSRTLVGLDIGSSGVRAAEYAPGRRPILRRFADVPLAPGVVRAGVVVDSAALTDALKALWSQGHFRSRTVTIGIANAGVLVRQLDLDWMPPADFRKALRYQVQDVLPFSVDEANLDYHLLEELEVAGEGGEPRRLARILLVAAAREMVDGFVAAARAAGLRPVGVDLLPFALLRTRQDLAGAGIPLQDGDEPDPVTEAIVDVGADVVSVVVHAAGRPRYVRIISGLGGDSITEAVRQRYDWTWEDAERTKIFVGLPGHAHLDPSQREALPPRTDGLDHAAQQVIADAARELAGEIATTLDYYRDSADDTTVLDPAGATGSAGVGRVLLTGAGASLGGFDELLAARLDVPVARLEPRLRGARRRNADPAEPAAAAAAGLCAGAAR